jgi:hypothetical protein
MSRVYAVYVKMGDEWVRRYINSRSERAILFAKSLETWFGLRTKIVVEEGD